MTASRIARADTRFGSTPFGGSNSAMIGSPMPQGSSGTRQIGGSGSRAFFALAILHLLLTRTCSPHASLEKGTKKDRLARQRRREVDHATGPGGGDLAPQRLSTIVVRVGDQQCGRMCRS